MKNISKAGHYFYGIGIAGIGIQQFIYADFRPVIMPAWPLWIHAFAIGAYISGAALVAAGVFIFLGKNGRKASLLLAGFLFILFIVFQCFYTLFIQPDSPRHLGL